MAWAWAGAGVEAGAGGEIIGGGDMLADGTTAEGNVPVAGAGSGGISSLTDAAPSGGPIEAVRRLTACNTRSVSS